MSVLENIQKALLCEIARDPVLSKLCLEAEGLSNDCHQMASSATIVVGRPQPQSAACNAQSVVLNDVLLSLIVSVADIPEDDTAGPLEIAEILCRRLHNLRLGVNSARGKLLLRKTSPLEYIKGPTGTSQIKINFNINSIKI